MRLDLNSYSFKIEIDTPAILSVGYSWCVTAIHKNFNADNLDGYKTELAKKSGSSSDLEACIKAASLAVASPEDWFSTELIEHMIKKENDEWIKEQIEKGNAILSNPLPPECPVCSKLLNIIPLRLKNKKLKLYTVCRASCFYPVTVFSDV
jgi:hypothetical protein